MTLLLKRLLRPAATLTLTRPCHSRRPRHVHSVAATGFNNQAEIYEKTRPSYPPSAIDHVLTLLPSTQDPKKKVLDLAAGGGKFTRLLVTQSSSSPLDVSAVEPVENMRKVFKTVLPNVPIFEGTAASIPFPKGTFDAVTIAQAFHWMSNLESLRDIHRVLKTKGCLILLWNMESRGAPWVADLRDVYEPYDVSVPQYRHGYWKQVFASAEGQQLFPGKLTTHFFQQEMLVTKTQVWERVLSKSYIASLPAAEQAVVKTRVEKVLDKHKAVFNIPSEGEKYARQPLTTEVTHIWASSSSS